MREKAEALANRERELRTQVEQMAEEAKTLTVRCEEAKRQMESN